VVAVVESEVVDVTAPVPAADEAVPVLVPEDGKTPDGVGVGEEVSVLVVEATTLERSDVATDRIELTTEPIDGVTPAAVVDVAAAGVVVPAVPEKVTPSVVVLPELVLVLEAAAESVVEVEVGVVTIPPGPNVIPPLEVVESVDAADVVSAIAADEVVVGAMIVDGKPPVVPAAESVAVLESVVDEVAGSTGT
jgi:hypothetical protein